MFAHLCEHLSTLWSLRCTTAVCEQRSDQRITGRNDQVTAVFLPYCEQFLTNDGQQQKGSSMGSSWLQTSPSRLDSTPISAPATRSELDPKQVLTLENIETDGED